MNKASILNGAGKDTINTWVGLTGTALVFSLMPGGFANYLMGRCAVRMKPVDLLRDFDPHGKSKEN